MILWDAIKKALRDFTDPVCQDWGSVHYDYYRDVMVRLVPVADPNNPNRIGEWVPDPEGKEVIDRVIAEREAAEAKREEESRRKSRHSEPCEETGRDNGGFNPVDVPGL